jgi:hypothetical protein
MEIKEYIKKTTFSQIIQRTLWQDIKLFFGYHKIPIKKYDYLPKNLKEVLHSCIHEPRQTTTDAQRKSLIRALYGVEGRKQFDPFDLVIDEEIKKLVPLTEQQIKEYTSKF